MLPNLERAFSGFLAFLLLLFISSFLTGCDNSMIQIDPPVTKILSTTNGEQKGVTSLADPISLYRSTSGVLVGDYYVSPMGNDAWTGKLLLPDPDGTDGPFKTLQKAKDTLRMVTAGGMDKDMTVVLRGGTYPLNATLAFDDRDSGKNGHQIRYINYLHEEPIINGAVPVLDWELHDNYIYKARINPFWQIGGLYEEGLRGRTARYPNEGYLKATLMDKEQPLKAFSFLPGEIPPVEKERELFVYIWSGGPDGDWNWFSDTVKVDNIDRDQKRISLRSRTHYEIGKGSRYYLLGVYEFLDQPGEYYVDKKEGILYYWPHKLPMEDNVIEVAIRSRLLSFNGSRPDRPVENITFEGITLKNSSVPEQVISETVQDAMLYMQNTRNITIKGCKIIESGYHGILMTGWNQQNTIYGNILYAIGHTAIQINSQWLSGKYTNKEHTISNNRIWSTGTRIGHGAGIQLMNSGDNQITHNNIQDTSRYGISMKGPRLGLILGTTIDDTKITMENVYEYLHTRNNYIAYNDISQANTDSQDSGLIEAWGTGLDNIIHNNALHSSEIPFSFGFGLYLDDAAGGFTVTNNVIYNLNHNGKGVLYFGIYSKGIGNIIKNNVVANNKGQAALGTMEMANEPNRDLIILRNIFYNTGPQIYGFFNWNSNRFANADFNLAYNTQGRYEIGGVSNVRTFDQWRDMLQHRYDQNSLLADPSFMDPQNHDFRLRPDTPAYSLGFEDIDYSSIGLKADFPFIKAQDPLERLFIKTNDNYSVIYLAENQERKVMTIGRMQSGQVMDLTKADIDYEVSAPDVVEISEQGVLKALKRGITMVTAKVTLKNFTQTIDFYVQVQ